MNVLVLNCGSSSVKAAVFDPQGDAVQRSVRDLSAPNVASPHRTALVDILHEISPDGEAGFGSVAHRVVHGGHDFIDVTRIDATVLEALRNLRSLAPLHNTANLAGIEVCLQLFPDVPQFAVFDTAFHRTLPEHAQRYPLPEAPDARQPIRRFGFHGISHAWVTGIAARLLGKPTNRTNLISLHLGSGASITAIENGRSVETSMGWTPLEGLMMSTRCGDLDPAIPLHLQREGNLSSEQVEDLLNRQAGLAGVCGESDMRRVHERADAGDADARLALDMYWHRIRKYIGAYFAVLGTIDALVFTGGVGENDPRTRAAACRGLDALGLRLDATRNRVPNDQARAIHDASAPTPIFVIPADEEAAMAHQVLDRLRRGTESFERGMP
jgi:acetate kinase